MSEPRIRTGPVLKAKKFRTKYRGNHLHVAIMEEGGRPVEIQITACDFDLASQDYTNANIDLIETLINMILQAEDPYSVGYLLECIGRKSRTKGDLAGRLVEVISKYLEG